MRARFSSAALSDTFERDPIDTNIFFPSGEKTMIGPVSAAAQQTTRRKMCREFLSRSARFEIAITIGKSNDAISIRAIQKLRVIARWIKSDPERFVQLAFCKSFIHVRFASPLVSRKTLIRLARLSTTEMSPFGAVSRNRGSKPAGVNSILKPGGTLGCASAGRSTTRARLIESIRARRWQILDRYFAYDARRIFVQSPIAALPVRTAPFSAAAPINGDEENGREKDCARNWIA